MIKFDHRKTEKKWQERWNKEGTYTPDVNNPGQKFYNLWMFPYPSAEGLHAGHAFASTGSDIYGRFMRMHKRNVFEPFGYDSFGIHAENYAIKVGENPKTVVERTTKHYKEQMISLGHGYDWTRLLTTSDPDYYRWTQWLFIEMYKAGLAYRKKAQVNFCPSCKTVLADEQVMSPKQAGKDPKDKNGKIVSENEDLRVCERCGTIAEKKELDQWFFGITKYADRLLEGLDKIEWSKKVSLAQKSWIGKSEGMIIEFGIDSSEEKIEVFTTRPDTLNSATFIAKSSKDFDSLEVTKEKLGRFTGSYAVNPCNGRKLPIWETNYVADAYGTGVIMGVPAYDERDMDFAKKYSLDILEDKPDESLWQKIEKEGWGRVHTTYHLRDWLVSRQRYWGAPIPMILCEECGWQTEEKLPVVLPEINDFKPEGTGRGPLANHPDFYKTDCPKCGKEARRETDVMDTFVDSSWYFLRYPSVGLANSDSAAFDDSVTKDWLPVDLYFGGAEHSVLHLMYARFINMVLYDRGYVKFEEPFPRFYAHGLMIKDGAKMSKSRGNVVNPDEYIDKFGADSLRLYLMFMGPMDGYPDFRDTGIEGMEKFVNRIWALANKPIKDIEMDKKYNSKLHYTIRKVTEDIKEFKYNTAISALMELVGDLSKFEAVPGQYLSILIQLIAPFAPHLCEEVWVEILKRPFSVHTSDWPVFDPELAKNDSNVIVIQVNGKLRGQIEFDKNQKPPEKEELFENIKVKPEISKWIEGKTVKNVIYVGGKLINIVVN